MTFTGNYIVYTCPYCEAEAAERELGSWNTFGATFWSDGFMIAPMAPTSNAVARCWKCKKAFDRWAAKSRTVSNLSSLRGGGHCPTIHWIGDWQAIREAMALRNSTADQDAEIGLRMRLLWASNHRFRTDGTDDHSVFVVRGVNIEDIPAEEVRENMRILSSLAGLPLWLKAEVLREMGDFDSAKEAIEQFKKTQSEEYEDGAKFFKEIERQIALKNSKVFKRR